ncbi:unknown [Choristoneura occidentalis cypovirus 16]|uniref:Uncharacterized protein n=1 Tax=Choristoneura fumiferana cypovirus TaxID=59730 RepID=A8W983_CPVCS|nr:unknown [Choristoneura occidentalis cypovirus 16]ABW87643.1 unknown [Choristoneura occidentalis cypovirus 16]
MPETYITITLKGGNGPNKATKPDIVYLPSQHALTRVNPNQTSESNPTLSQYLAGKLAIDEEYLLSWTTKGLMLLKHAKSTTDNFPGAGSIFVELLPFEMSVEFLLAMYNEFKECTKDLIRMRGERSMNEIRDFVRVTNFDQLQRSAAFIYVGLIITRLMTSSTVVDDVLLNMHSAALYWDDFSVYTAFSSPRDLWRKMFEETPLKNLLVAAPVTDDFAIGYTGSGLCRIKMMRFMGGGAHERLQGGGMLKVKLERSHDSRSAMPTKNLTDEVNRVFGATMEMSTSTTPEAFADVFVAPQSQRRQPPKPAPGGSKTKSTQQQKPSTSGEAPLQPKPPQPPRVSDKILNDPLLEQGISSSDENDN